MPRRKCKIWRPKAKKKSPNADGSSSSAPLPMSPSPSWIELPADVTANILHRLGAVEILETAQKVCTNWRKVCKDPSMWRVVDMWYLGDLHVMPYNLEIMCRHAVDRSQGQLIDISIEYFGTDELLFYIGERCRHLKCLTLACCYDISNEGLTKAVENFPELVELHLFYMKSINDEDIENIGNSCPKLESFTYNRKGCKHITLTDAESNGNALAVAKSMPNLHHLRLCGDTMNNEGLEAILNSCPYLESLHIRQCFSIDLMGDLGKRCWQQIKYLRCPNDATDDYPWDSSIYDEHYLYDGNYSSDLSFGYSIEDYDDYTDPFHPDYFYDDEDTWIFDPHAYFP